MQLHLPARSVKSLNSEKSPSEEPNSANYRLNASSQLLIERAQRRILEYIYIYIDVYIYIYRYIDMIPV